MLLAITVVHFQEDLYVHTVGNITGDVAGVIMGRSFGRVLQKNQRAPVPAKQIILWKNPYLQHFEWHGMVW